MIAPATKPSASYSRAIELLRQLHDLIATGEGESSAADQVRDEMDIHWPLLADVERQRVEGLSGDLYSLTGNELYAPEDRLNPVPAEELRAAWSAGDYDRVLTLLHRPAPFLNAAEIAFMRAHCWAQLGDPETALLFFRRAHRLSPDDEQYTTMLMLTYLGRDRLSDARECATRLAKYPSVTAPAILLRAAGVLYATLEGTPGAETSAVLAQIVKLIETAIANDQRLPISDRLRATDLARYEALAATCYWVLGERDKAIGACQRALHHDPENEMARTAQAALVQGTPVSVAEHQALRDRFVALVKQDQDFTIAERIPAASA